MASNLPEISELVDEKVVVTLVGEMVITVVEPGPLSELRFEYVLIGPDTAKSVIDDETVFASAGLVTRES